MESVMSVEKHLNQNKNVNEKGEGYDYGKRKHLAAWFSIIFIFVTLASLFYIVKEENHKCTGEDCPVCACV